MDILKQYEQQFPEANKPAPQWQPPDEYGPIVRFFIKLSGGWIKNEKQANTIMLILGIIGFILTYLLLFGVPGTSAPNQPLLESVHPGLPERFYKLR